MTQPHPPKLLAATLMTFFVILFPLVSHQVAALQRPTTPITGGEFIAPDAIDHSAQSLQAKVVADLSWEAEQVVTTLTAMQNFATTVRQGQALVATQAVRVQQVQTQREPEPYQLSAELQTFIRDIRTAGQDVQNPVLRGLYVEGILAQPILQQPTSEPAFVSVDPQAITEFGSATNNGVTGLLAHNYLIGQVFYQIAPGQMIWTVKSDGSYTRYIVKGIYQYQKLSPSDLRSDLIDLSTGQRVTTDQVFARFYRGEHHLTLQTCLERNGLSNWGLTFIYAEPMP